MNPLRFALIGCGSMGQLSCPCHRQRQCRGRLVGHCRALRGELRGRHGRASASPPLCRLSPDAGPGNGGRGRRGLCPPGSALMRWLKRRIRVGPAPAAGEADGRRGGSLRRPWSPWRRPAARCWPSATNCGMSAFMGQGEGTGGLRAESANRCMPDRIVASSLSPRVGGMAGAGHLAPCGNWILEEPIHFFDLARWYLAPAAVRTRCRSLPRPTADAPMSRGVHDNFQRDTSDFPRGRYAVISQTLAGWEHHQVVKLTGTRRHNFGQLERHVGSPPPTRRSG